MKRKILSSLLATLALAVGITSCNTDDAQYEYDTNNECLVTSMYMGALRREMHTTDSIGKDSTFYVTVTGALYPLTIDQERLRIYNVDSLPVGTDVKHTVFSAIKTIGVATLRSLETGNDTIFNLSDSIDFSKPRILTIHATDGVSKREYLVSINVHKEEGDTMVWYQVDDQVDAFSQLENTRSIAVDQQLYLFGEQEGKTQVLCAAADGYNDGGHATWYATTLSTPLRPQSVVRFHHQFYAVNTDNRLMTSTDGTGWTLLNTEFTASTLILSTDHQIVALKDGKFYSSADGLEWQMDEVDEAAQLPQSIATGTVVPSRIDKTFETLVVVGESKGQPVVWKREIDLTGKESFPWIYLPGTLTSAYNLPALSQMSVSPYDGAVLLSGLTSDKQNAPLYLSRDYGRTWKTMDIKSPAASGKSALAVTVDHKNFIWMFCGQTGEVWRGRINRLGWEPTPGTFTKSIHR